MKESFDYTPETKRVVEQIRHAVAERLDDLATDPKLKNAGIPLDLGEKIRTGKKVPGFVLVRDAIISVCHEYRLMPKDIDFILNKFLEQ